MCVFVPTFESMVRGEGNKQKKACIKSSMKNLLKKIGYHCVSEDAPISQTSFGLMVMIMMMMTILHIRNTYLNYTAKQRSPASLRIGGNVNNLFLKTVGFLKY